MNPVKRQKTIVFCTTNQMWGGSEELWSRTALLLAQRGLKVSASVGFPTSHERIVELGKSAVYVQERYSDHSVSKRIWRRMFAKSKTFSEIQLDALCRRNPPDLLVISDGLGLLRSLELVDYCFTKNIPFVTICHINAELFWPTDGIAERLRTTLPTARRCYFVSESNRRLFEKQIGFDLPNSAIVRNPVNIDITTPPRWPSLSEGSELRFASVGRIEPLMKGQDIVLDALARPEWRKRNWRLTFYGDGPMKGGVERMVQRYALQDRVQFAGYVRSVNKIWEENHVLVMPSRYEGLPLVIVEAMLCGRPIVATDVAGHAEVIEDGCTGFLAEAPTARCFANALERLWMNRERLELMGKAAAKRISEMFPADPVKVFADEIIRVADLGTR